MTFVEVKYQNHSKKKQNFVHVKQEFEAQRQQKYQQRKKMHLRFGDILERENENWGLFSHLV